MKTQGQEHPECTLIHPPICPTNAEDGHTQLAQNAPALVGLDFPFSFPQGFVASQGVSEDSWDDVLRFFARVEDLRGFIESHRPPFYRTGGFGLDTPFQAYRHTERACASRPETVFHDVGPKQVAKAAVRGMQALGRLRSQSGADVRFWPFDGPADADCSAVVEIFPRVFLDEMGRPSKNDRAARGRTVDDMIRRGLCSSDTQRSDAIESDDAFDALASAFGMWQRETGGQGCSSYPAQIYSDPAVRIEGWIWGVPYAGPPPAES